MNRSLFLRLLLFLVVLIILVILFVKRTEQNELANKSSLGLGPDTIKKYSWHPPDTNRIPSTEEGERIRYGKELISNTSVYLGPKGSVSRISNGMNCQNCHIDAGMKSFSNCFSAVASIYPVFRPRSGIVESIEFRINDCLKRSLNGQPMDTLSKEMVAMVSYLKWLGKGVQKGIKPIGSNIVELPYLERMADTAKGRIVYVSKCQSCHQKNGEGFYKSDSSGFIYPPLWGASSYNTGAGLYRLSRFAGYVKSSMPNGASYSTPLLSNEEAWDVAAFVNSQPRPVKHFPQDWPDLSRKAVDHPYGPYKDSFSEMQHKYGPFKPIIAYRKNPTQ
jgi:thiosulfate dehydrogenase